MTAVIRILTATAIFDGHDVSINIMRHVLQEHGAEIIHLGFNHSVDDVVNAAVQEDVDAIAISSYQGGHLEYFKYLVDRLTYITDKKSTILLFGGGGGTITEQEAVELEKYGVTKIYTVAQGVHLGLDGMALDILQYCKSRQTKLADLYSTNQFTNQSTILDNYNLSKSLSIIERGFDSPPLNNNKISNTKSMQVIGITGTGGSGKSTFIDELLKALLDLPENLKIAYFAIDPTRKKSGGALLGDRLRVNCQFHERLFMRSIATRTAHVAIPAKLKTMIRFLEHQGFDLLLIETAGIGQSDSSIVELVNQAYYVMTQDYGAPSQLEKIEMLDYANKVILNKCDQAGSEDAYLDICVQWRRNHKKNEAMLCPVYPIIANKFNDAGTRFCIKQILFELNFDKQPELFNFNWQEHSTHIIPEHKVGYLHEIASNSKKLSTHNLQQIKHVSRVEAYYQSLIKISEKDVVDNFTLYERYPKQGDINNQELVNCYNSELNLLDENTLSLLAEWPARISTYNYDNSNSTSNYVKTLSDIPMPKISVPRFNSQADLLEFLLSENLAGEFPYTAGVYRNRFEEELPARMFAGAGVPEDTNHRFFYLLQEQKSTRLSTAFDPITLYGCDPTSDPDIFGCIGMSGVSVACLDDMKKLYSGINLGDKSTSVSMTINGPATIMLAWFFNTAIDQQVEIYLKNNGQWRSVEKKIEHYFKNTRRPEYNGLLPNEHDGLGLATLGISGKELLDADTYEKIKNNTLENIRGTLQADILKEDLAQNECIFSLPFGLLLMSDIQQYFINNKIKKYYSVSISGYHIAEAGANPVTQLAFTLANAFTYVEYYLSRGMKVDDFVSNFSFFFSNGMDPEYAVIGRVARRIWARAMRYRYYASNNSQKLKYHIQTSGRSLQMQDIELNEVRTTLQALYAINDNCNSLHTNAYDEAVTTPTEESVHRALAVQMIINQELGLNINQNPLQGSYVIKELSEKVENEVYNEFIRISQRGGVIGALEKFYQRSKIQKESLYYENRKNDGTIPIVGVNTFIMSDSENIQTKFKENKIIHCSADKKQQQLDSLALFLETNKEKSEIALAKLVTSFEKKSNSFECFMDISRYCSLGQITNALYAVGGQYRRKM